MDEKNFVFWLNGFFELSGAKELNEQQVQIIKDHIKLVMKKVTPNVNPYPNTGYIPASLSSDKIELYPDGPRLGTPENPHKFETFCTTLTDTTDMPLNIQTHLTC